ncbi:SusE domain-containing protein [Terrimonas pollutisoli]|uniref:SusE domain-containing protein n=1 Tax=Terrimonas pollutisoli TaxID=3034147 RepID=UPI0023EDD05F|nr:SusE domain-containing protein [Terrimonas sp. H1YJ31]
MKNITKLLFGFFLLTGALSSCKKDEDKIFLESSTAPVLTASSTDAMVLTNADKDKTAITLNWTNPDYKFTTGISSQNVTYTLQFDTLGSNFTKNRNIQEMAIANDLGVTLSVKELNSFLSKMELLAGKAYNMEMRVKATLVNNSVPLYSNVIQIKITPYLDFAVEPPGTAANNYDDGNLWVTGDCFPSPDWANPLPSPYDGSLKFTKIDKLHYELEVNFDKTGGYKMIQEQGNWDTQYHAITAGAALSGDFKKENADPQFASPGAGKYKIEVNFQTGKYKLTPQ